MRVLVVTSEWPRSADDASGTGVVSQVTHLRAAGVEVDVFPLRARHDLRRYVATARSLRRGPLDSYDLIHAHHLTAGLVALAQSQRPVVATLYGSDVFDEASPGQGWSSARSLRRLACRWVARTAQEVIAATATLAPLLPRRRWHLIPPGVDLARFRPMPRWQARRMLGLPQQVRLVLTVEAPHPAKGACLTQGAFEMLPADLTARPLAAEAVPVTRRPLYLNACDALLLLTRGGPPNLVMEALACNLPVIATEGGAVGRWLAGVAGCVLCPEARAAAIATAVARVLRAESRCAGRALVQDRDERLLAQRIIRVYEQAMGWR